ncbi:MAG: CDP-alcohol phosphatidyltransferase family protein [Candidatus Heimdallarchaeota archaeon]
MGAIYNKYFLLAFLFTTLNAICGIAGIFVSLYLPDNLFYLPFQLLIFGAIFDFLDGQMAKRAPLSSSFGAYFDSIGDVITFAILPGIMLLNAPLLDTGQGSSTDLFSLGIAGFYTICGWIRLVRFASQPTAIHFDGLPSPAAALLMGSCALLAQHPELTWLFPQNGVVLALIALAIGVLMILTIKYPTPKRGKTPDMVAIGIAGIVVLAFVFLPHYLTLGGVLFIAVLYTVLGPIYLIRT